MELSMYFSDNYSCDSVARTTVLDGHLCNTSLQKDFNYFRQPDFLYLSDQTAWYLVFLCSFKNQKQYFNVYNCNKNNNLIFTDGIPPCSKRLT